MQYSLGTVADLTTTVTNASGQSVDPDSIEAEIYSPTQQIVDNGVPTRISTGFFRYSFDIPEDAQVGLWRINWNIVRGGTPASGDEYFEVIDPGSIVNPSDAVVQSQLRSRLGESKVDPDSDGSETFFSDEQILEILSYADNDLDLATLEGWRRKMARYARLVDVTESGADRKMSQKFKNAKDMVAFWSKLAGAAVIDRQNALAGRVVGRAVNLRCDPSEPILTPFSGYSEHVREYPTHRLLIPAILS